MIRLVVNADDLGLAPEIDDGIFEAASRGIVTSASVLVAGRSFEAARRRIDGLPLGVGVHLTAVGGFPPVATPASIPWLCDGGRLPASWRALVRKLVVAPAVAGEVLTEFDAQLARARDADLAIDHVDAHQHLHVWPSLFPGVVALCRRYGVSGVRVPDERPSAVAFRRLARGAAMLPLAALGAWARRRLDGLSSPRFFGLYDGGAMDRAALLALIERLPDADCEIGCHPGKGVQGVPEDPDWRCRWDAELVALCDPEVRRAVERRGIRLCRYGDLSLTPL